MKRNKMIQTPSKFTGSLDGGPDSLGRLLFGEPMQLCSTAHCSESCGRRGEYRNDDDDDGDNGNHMIELSSVSDGLKG